MEELDRQAHGYLNYSVWIATGLTDTSESFKMA
jgi:hypothetical protein